MGGVRTQLLRVANRRRSSRGIETSRTYLVCPNRLAPAHQGMKIGAPFSRGFSTASRDQGWLTVCRDRGTSPSPRGVFDRATFPFPALLDSRPPQADTGYASCGNDEREIGLTNAGTHGTAKFHSRTNRSCRLAPAHQGMKSRSRGFMRRICTGDSAMPHPPAPAGDKPPRYILLFRLRTRMS